jgi:predicted NUDIX family NTP pyrophosphohydrolase
MGGPLWAHKDLGAWSIPKGEYDDDEPALDAARREFTEELGVPPPEGELVDLGESVQRSGKVVTVWAVEGEVDLSAVVPGTFTMEWPRGSGQVQEFPELDRFVWFTVPAAHDAVFERQRPFLDRLEEHLEGRG